MGAKEKTGTGMALCEVAKKVKGRPRRPHDGYLEVNNVNLHNVKDLSVRFPKGVLCCVTGVAGSGKSTITFQGLVRQHPDIVRWCTKFEPGGLCRCGNSPATVAALGAEQITMDQSALSRSNRSTPATYVHTTSRRRLHKPKCVLDMMPCFAVAQVHRRLDSCARVVLGLHWRKGCPIQLQLCGPMPRVFWPWCCEGRHGLLGSGGDRVQGVQRAPVPR